MTIRKKILVTGGAGYIGAHTCVCLAEEGYEPIIVDSLLRSDDTLLNGISEIIGSSPRFVQADCTDEVAMKKVFRDEGPIAGVMHFAALKSVGESVRIPLEYYRNNVGSLVVLLAVMAEFGVTDLIFSSSCTVYGQPEIIPVTEETAQKRAESPYGATKQVCERILEDVSKTGVRVISLRYFNPIGAHPTALIGEIPLGVPSNLVPYITQTAAGKREKLVIHGDDYNTPDGSCIRDYIHVMDVADAHVKALDYLVSPTNTSRWNAYNLGTGSGVSVLGLVERFMKATGERVNFVIGPRRPGDVEKIYADPSKANKALGWSAKYTIDQALLDAWNWELSLSKRNPQRN